MQWIQPKRLKNSQKYLFLIYNKANKTRSKSSMAAAKFAIPAQAAPRPT
jgi:hypothetical protein